MKNLRGFTLTEILLVSAMFAVISIAVFNAFSNGFKLWAKGEHVLKESDAAMLLDRMSEDLRQTLVIKGIDFKGDRTELSFASLVIGPLDSRGSRAHEERGLQVGAVRYFFDPIEKKVYRSQASYGQALKSKWMPPTAVASLIEDVTLRYYFKGDGALNLKNKTEEGVPLGVMMDVQLMIDGQIRHLRRFLVVPVGGGV